VRSDLSKTLWADIASNDEDVRNRALRVIVQIIRCFNLDSVFPVKRYTRFSDIWKNAPAKVIVDCLCGLLPEALRRQRADVDNDWDEPINAESDALLMLSLALHRQRERLLQEGLITRWLAAYPFARIGATPLQRHEVVLRYIQGRTPNLMMNEILDDLYHDPRSKDQLRQAGLIGSAIREELEDNDGDVEMIDFLEFQELGYERREESPEEAQLRRRRRNAVAMASRGEPFRIAET